VDSDLGERIVKLSRLVLIFTTQLIVCGACGACGAAAALVFGWISGRIEWYGSIMGSFITASMMLMFNPQQFFEDHGKKN
jgi:hypothetical protein